VSRPQSSEIHRGLSSYTLTIINKILSLAISYKVSLFKENLKLRRKEDNIILRAYKVTLNTALLHRLLN
jgi:hypothetical protein